MPKKKNINSQDTIFALSTIAGKSGVAIIRISGKKAIHSLKELGVDINAIEPRKAYVVKLISPKDKELLDEAIAIYFASPNSFTGEDIVELHLHGSLAVINDVTKILSQIPYLRPAEPGEFSKRAFLNGKLDLTRAEGLAELINAETSIQRKIALRQLGGELENIYEKWRGEIIGILAKASAFIDFPDEDLPPAMLTAVYEQVKTLIVGIKQHLTSAETGESIMKGIEVAIIGAPNVGKSSLLNALAKRDAAIVSEIAGTTRDVIEVRLNLNGYLVTLYDTAGLRKTKNSIEAEGVNRTKRKIETSDIIVVVIDLKNKNSLEILKSEFLIDKDVVVVGNKLDLVKLNNAKTKFTKDAKLAKVNIIPTSAKLGRGINALVATLTNKISQKYSVSSSPIITNARYRFHLQKCIKFLQASLKQKKMELIASHIYNAANSIGSITGRVEIEEILDTIFSSFCIGK